MKRTIGKILVAMMLLCACAAQADVWMPGVFSDNMVLQRGKPAPVWGWADPGEKVTVEFGDQWYSLKIAVQGSTTEVFVDGESVLKQTDGKDDAPTWGGVGLGGWKSTTQWRNIRLTGPSGEVLFSEAE